MRIGYLVCPSGLGHLTRTAAIIDQLQAEIPSIEVTVHLASWQCSKTAAYPPLARAQLAPVEKAFSTDPHSRAQWVECALGGSVYDFLVSDNLLEAFWFDSSALFVGSFLWPTTTPEFVDDPLWRSVNERQSPAFGSELFAMPAVRQLAGFQPVGLVGRSVRRQGWGKEILISFGRSSAAVGLCDEVVNWFRESGEPAGVLFDNVYEGQIVGGFTRPFYERFAVAIIRPGLGTVSDCLRYGVPMVLLFEDGNEEMAWNAQRLVERGLATVAEGIEQALDLARAWQDEAKLSAFDERRLALRWDGEGEIAQELTRRFVEGKFVD